MSFSFQDLFRDFRCNDLLWLYKDFKKIVCLLNLLNICLSETPSSFNKTGYTSMFLKFDNNWRSAAILEKQVKC